MSMINSNDAFRAIASTVRANRESAAGCSQEHEGAAYAQALDDLAGGLVDVGMAADPSFSAKTFLRACGVPQGKSVSMLA